jgi:hypothetical protein
VARIAQLPSLSKSLSKTHTSAIASFYERTSLLIVSSISFVKLVALPEAALARIMRRILSILPFVLLLQAVPPVFAQESAPLDPIEQVVAAQLMSPYPDGNFRPERILNRAELASILVKTFKLDRRQPKQQATISLQDVPSSHWAYNDIQLVLKNNIMTGYRPGQFFPNQRVTRAEAFSILAQAYGVFQFPEDTVAELLSKYADSDKIPTWARKSIATALYEGFVNVEPTKNQINPLEPMTRGDMAYALSKYLERLEDTAPMPWKVEEPIRS